MFSNPDPSTYVSEFKADTTTIILDAVMENLLLGDHKSYGTCIRAHVSSVEPYDGVK